MNDTYKIIVVFVIFYVIPGCAGLIVLRALLKFLAALTKHLNK